MVSEKFDKKEEMSGFKLLAIRPLEGCDKKFIKNLKEGMVYKLFQDYDYYVKKNRSEEKLTINNYKSYSNAPITRIDPIGSGNQLDLYSTDDIKINISAIVGKNGSGKSSLIEFFYLFIFKISEKEILEMDSIEDIKKLSKESNNAKYEDIIEQLKKLGRFNCEILFKKDNDYCSLKLIGDDLNYINFNDEFDNDFEFSKFCYSIAINYSLYGLNDKYDNWLSPLFHKNDGYKTPLVINPMRTKGNIDVNKELHLGQSRTILNLTNIESDSPEIINERRISKVRFVLDISDNNHIRNTHGVNHPFTIVSELHKTNYDESIFDLFNAFSMKMCNFQLSDQDSENLDKLYKLEESKKIEDRYLYSENSNEQPTDQKIKYELIKYSIRKVFKICTQYPEYGIFLKSISKKEFKEPLEIIDKEGLLDRLEKDKSHITLKLRQIIHSIKAEYFENDNWLLTPYYKDINTYSYKIEFDWKDLRKAITEYDNDEIIDKLEIIPSAFLKPEFIMEDDFGFEKLSSGEQHLANIVQTVIYHLYNLNSVHTSGDTDRYAYNYINIIFDEVELYFHPEFQRLFVHNLLQGIKGLKLDKQKIKGLNILFATHSPFILSDIPSSNILRLRNGEPESEKNQTFGANIHDLLANDFFLKDGFMGEFAKRKINDIIEYLTFDPNKSESESNIKPKVNWTNVSSKEFISIIGEPVLRMKLAEMYDEKFKVDFEVELLQKRINEIKDSKTES